MNLITTKSAFVRMMDSPELAKFIEQRNRFKMILEVVKDRLFVERDLPTRQFFDLLGVSSPCILVCRDTAIKLRRDFPAQLQAHDLAIPFMGELGGFHVYAFSELLLMEILHKTSE